MKLIKPALREIEDVLKAYRGFGWASREELAVEMGKAGRCCCCDEGIEGL